MTRRLIIRNGNFMVDYLPPSGDLLIEGGKIVGVVAPNTDIWPDAEVIDATDRFVLPGLVDPHTHIQLDTGIYQTDDNWDIGTKVAAFGGVTTVIDFATQLPGMTFKKALQKRMEQAKSANVDYGFHMMLTRAPGLNELNNFYRDLDWLVNEGVMSVKLFTTYRPNYYLDDDALLRIFYALRPGMVAMVHCENDAMVSASAQRFVERGLTSLAYHADARPPEAEYEASMRIIALSDLARTAIPYIVHCSWGETIQTLLALREARQQPFYLETCPQYFTLSDEVYKNSLAFQFIMQPPLRNMQSVQMMPRLFPLVDVIATDHCDYSIAKKQAVDDFTKTPGGIPGLETSLQLTFSAYKKAVVALQASPLFSMMSMIDELDFDLGGMLPKPSLDADMEREILGMIAKQMSERPAQIFGIYPQKGNLMPGADADVVIFNPKTKTTLKTSKMHHIGGYSPYEGTQVFGKVETTISRGEVLVQKGRFKGKAGHGRFVKGTLAES